MRPVRSLGGWLCLLGSVVACREGHAGPPAARLAPASPGASASTSSRPEATERDRVLLDGSTRGPLIGPGAPGGERVHARAL